MRHFVIAAALIGCSLMFVNTTAAMMQREAMRGHEVPANFNPGELASPALLKAQALPRG
jgi:hypothetical protein